MHHSYVFDPNVVDAAVLRAQAEKRLTDIRFPEETDVHYHRVGQPCTERCEHFRFADLKEEEGTT